MVQASFEHGHRFWKGKEQLITKSIVWICAFYLAQAVVFEASVPFLLPFWAVIKSRYPSFNRWVLVGGFSGSLFLGLGQAVILCGQLLLFTAIERFRYMRVPLPIGILLSTLVVQGIWQVIAHSGDVPMLVIFYIASEVVLAYFITFFMQIFFVNAHEWFQLEWGTERIAAGLVIFATLLTGMGDVTIASFGLAPFLLHIIICLSAFIGGIQSATVVAIVVGALLSLAKLSFTGMIAVYGMTGLVAGLCARYGKIAIVMGSVCPSLFYYFYDATLPLDEVYFVSIGSACILFLALRKSNLEKLSLLFMPETENILLKRQSWMTEHVSVKLAHFQQFVTFMTELVFDRFTSVPEQMSTNVGPVTSCLSCFRYETCWGVRHNGMNQVLTDLFTAKGSGQLLAVNEAEKQLHLKCLKSTVLLEELESQFYRERINEQFYHGKKMIALQLKEMSSHLQRLIEEMQQEAISFVQLEERLIERLQQAYVECFQVDLINNAPGERKIVCSVAHKKSQWESEHAIAERMILPVLFDVFGEPLQVEKMIEKSSPFSHCQISFRSAVPFQIEYDIYSSAKGSTLWSGDSHDVFSIHPGLTAVMLADGMGQSKEARQESKQLVNLMRECLHYNMSPETAMHTLHYVMSLKRESDMYATIDFALIDLQGGCLWTWKAGGMSTLVLRGEELLKVESNAAPVGFLSVFSVETVKLPMKAGDVIVMYSDGLFSAVDEWETQENCFLQQLRIALTEQPNLSLALEMTIARFQDVYIVEDDCTVIVLRIGHVMPEWSVYAPAEFVTV